MKIIGLRSVALLAATMAFLLLDVGPAQAQYKGELEHWVPDSRRAEARGLVDPGDEGLGGTMKFNALKLPEFQVTYEGSDGALVVQLHPPTVKVAGTRNWTGKRVAITTLRSTLKREALAAAMTALISLIKSREHRWLWTWRKSSRPSAGAAGSLASSYRHAAYGDLKKWLGVASIIDRTQAASLPEALQAAAMAYDFGPSGAKVARGWAVEFVVTANKNLARAQAAGTNTLGPRLLLARALALSGDLDRLGKIQGGLLNGTSACAAILVGRALKAAGHRDKALRFVEDGLLPRAPKCAEAVYLAVDLRLEAGQNEEAEKRLSGVGTKLNNEPLFYLAKARVDLAMDRLEEAISSLRIALRVGLREPRVVDLAASTLLKRPPPVRMLTMAKKQMELRPQDQGAQFFAGILCAAYHDLFCVKLAAKQAGRSPRSESAPHVAVLRLLEAAETGHVEDSRRLLKNLWGSQPDVLLPMVIESAYALFTEKPSPKILEAQMSRIYGAPYAKLMLNAPQNTEQAETKTENAVTPADEPPPADSEPVDPDDTLFPPWILLMAGALLTLLALTAVFRNRA